MNRDRAIALVRDVVATTNDVHEYHTDGAGDLTQFQPHEWVVEAVQRAFELGRVFHCAGGCGGTITVDAVKCRACSEAS